MKFKVVLYKYDIKWGEIEVDLDDPEYGLDTGDKITIAEELIAGMFVVVPWQYEDYWNGIPGTYVHMLLSIFE